MGMTECGNGCLGNRTLTNHCLSQQVELMKPYTKVHSSACFSVASGVTKGSAPDCRNGPAGGAHNRGLTPFRAREACKVRS